MSLSIVPQLIRKDLHIMRYAILSHGVVGLIAIALLAALVEKVPQWLVLNLGLVLLVAPAGTCGIVLLIKTIVFEKEKSTQPFILSLPLTVKEFTQAKLLVNLLVFSAFWLVAAGAGFYFAFGREVLPLGAVPFVTMIFAGVFAAYTCILAVSLAFQSLGITVLSIAIFEMATSGYLWTIAFLDPVRRHVFGPVAIWDTTSVAIVAAQALAVVAAISATMLVQNRKRDFI